MKKRKAKRLLIVLLGVVLMSSCTMTKRRYAKGFYIEKNKNYVSKQKKSKENDFEKEETDESSRIEPVSKVEKDTETVLIASVNNEVLIPKKELFKEELKKEIRIKEKEIKQEKIFPISYEETKKRKKNKIGKDEPIEITKREIRAIMAIIFALCSVIVPSYFSILGIVYGVLGLKSDLKTMSRFALIFSLIILAFAIYSYIFLQSFYLFGVAISG